jgi:hypothetical protein
MESKENAVAETNKNGGLFALLSTIYPNEPTVTVLERLKQEVRKSPDYISNNDDIDLSGNTTPADSSEGS